MTKKNAEMQFGKFSEEMDISVSSPPDFVIQKNLHQTKRKYFVRLPYATDSVYHKTWF